MVRGGCSISENEHPLLVVLRGPSFGDVYTLNGETLVLGSDPFRADVVVRDMEVEPRQGKISRGAEGYTLRDLGTGDAITINDEVLDDARPLSCGDRIHVGGSVLEYIEHDTVRKQFHKKIQRLINEDYLTGLLAKNRFDEKFDQTLEASRERNLPLSILMADIDNLKSINDSHGHLLGEFTVGQIGHIIKECYTSGERYATRFGGDEYEVLLPGMSKEEALVAAERIRRRVEEYSFERDGLYANPTLSLGAATYPEDGATADALTGAADKALYRAKNHGGNTVSE
ncbi:MAG: diguanylate cyclase [Rubrobacteraceae bacterium]